VTLVGHFNSDCCPYQEATVISKNLSLRIWQAQGALTKCKFLLLYGLELHLQINTFLSA